MKTLLILSAAVPLSLVLALEAHADGGLITTRIEGMREPEQKGIVLFRDGQQDLILEVRYEGPPEDFVWLVPLPAPPEISVDVPAVFADLKMQTLVWGPPTGLAEWTPRADVPALVRLPDGEPRSSIWDFTVLPPSHQAVRRWLHARDITPTTHAQAVLDSYVRAGWYFVGMTIGSEGRDLEMARALLRGTIQPVRFRFATPEPVFPLRISAVNPGFSDIQLYVFADQALVNRSARLAGWDTRCYGRMSPPPGLDRDGAWSSPGRPAPFLTRLQARFHAYEMAEDVYFRGYDPRPGLRSRNPDERLGALAWIGTIGDRRWTGDLVRFGEKAPLGGEEQTALAWALGRLGDPAAAPLLTRLAASGPGKWEALRSLVIVDPRSAAGLLQAQLEQLPPDLPRQQVRHIEGNRYEVIMFLDGGGKSFEVSRFLIDNVLLVLSQVDRTGQHDLAWLRERSPGEELPGNLPDRPPDDEAAPDRVANLIHRRL